MTVSKEKLMAFIDGEVSADQSRRLKAEIAKDAALAAYVERQKALKTHLDHTFSHVITAPARPHLERMIMEARLPLRPRSRAVLGWIERLFSAKSLGWTLIPAGALAAGIAIGLFVANAGGATVIADRNRTIVATNALARALSTQLASEQNPVAPIRIGVSFLSKVGNYCRSFTSETGATALAGIACSSAEEWRIVALENVQATNAGTFQPAAAAMPDGLRGALTGMISGVPLDAKAEREARDRLWRAR